MFRLPESVKLRDASLTLRSLTEALEREPRQEVLTIDASGLRDFDSSAIAVLLECQRRARASGQRVAVQQAPAQLVELAGLYGVQALVCPAVQVTPGPRSAAPAGSS